MTDHLTADRPLCGPLLRLVCYAAGGFLSICCSLEGSAPLAAGLMAAIRPGLDAGAVFLGAAGGGFLVLPFSPALRCCGILVLIWSVTAAFHGTRWAAHPLFRPLTAAGTTLAVELAYLLQSGLSVPAFLRLGAAASLSALCAHYCALLRRTPLPRRQTSREVEAMRQRLQLSAEALRSLGQAITSSAPQQEENPAVIFDRAAEVVCRGCALRDICWNREYITTFNAFNDATPAIMQRGRAETGDFPSHFASRCIHLPQLTSAISTEVKSLLLRRQYRRQLETERRRTRGQYDQLAELVAQTMAAETPPSAGPELQFDVALGSQPKAGQRLCGDSATWFRGPGSTIYLLLCDGMGCGREAQRESRMALRLLEQFLAAGIQPESALRTVNGALNMRSEERGSFTTIDLVGVDLASGQARLFKLGAAPSYLKHQASVRRLAGSSLPAGLQDPANLPPAMPFSLEENSFLLLVSDGIADSSEDQWLLDLLTGWHGEDPNVLVSLVLRESFQRRRGDDDCSAVCLYLPRRGRGKREV